MHMHSRTHTHSTRDVAVNVRLVDGTSVALGTETHVSEVRRTLCIHVCMYVCMHACVETHVSVLNMRVSMYVYMYLVLCVYACMLVCMYLLYVCSYVTESLCMLM